MLLTIFGSSGTEREALASNFFQQGKPKYLVASKCFFFLERIVSCLTIFCPFPNPEIFLSIERWYAQEDLQ